MGFYHHGSGGSGSMGVGVGVGVHVGQVGEGEEADDGTDGDGDGDDEEEEALPGGGAPAGGVQAGLFILEHVLLLVRGGDVVGDGAVVGLFPGGVFERHVGWLDGVRGWKSEMYSKESKCKDCSLRGVEEWEMSLLVAL